MRLKTSICALALFVGFCTAVPIVEDQIINEREVRAAVIGRPDQANLNPADYLVQFGYLQELKQGVQYDPQSVTDAIKSFQRMADIPQTGNIDEETQKMMLSPRCGVSDQVGSGKLGATKTKYQKTKRYALQGGAWSRKDLTYKFHSYSRHLTQSQVRDAIYRAFKLWSDVSELTFREVSSGEADIVIEFATYQHSDGAYAAFDGPGGTLAHAYFPENGDAHFDDSETYTVYTDQGTNLYIVAAHEFGHSLGLGHSSSRGALMYPWYQGYVPNYKLPQDDTLGIQQLYGLPDTSRPGEEGGDGSSKPDKPDRPDQNIPPESCTDPFDTIFRDKDGTTWAFRGKFAWKINEVGVEEGYPVKISRIFKGLPGNINAAVTSSWSGRTYFFKGDRMWRYLGHDLEAGFPKRLPRANGVKKNLDAAFVWGGNGQIYLFKGNLYWQFNEYRQSVEPGYPQKIKSHWKGAPKYIDAAFQWENGKTYFFKGDEYWRFDDIQLKVDKGYPKSKAKYWMGCSGDSPFEKLQQGPLTRSGGIARDAVTG